VDRHGAEDPLHRGAALRADLHGIVTHALHDLEVVAVTAAVFVDRQGDFPFPDERDKYMRGLDRPAEESGVFGGGALPAAALAPLAGGRTRGTVGIAVFDQ
jgi:hypothetical protein